MGGLEVHRVLDLHEDLRPLVAVHDGRRRRAVLLRDLLRVLRAYVAMNFVHHLANFRRLVCGCMDSYDSEQSHILQHSSSSTR